MKFEIVIVYSGCGRLTSMFSNRKFSYTRLKTAISDRFKQLKENKVTKKNQYDFRRLFGCKIELYEYTLEIIGFLWFHVRPIPSCYN